jgi:hypothetical protein
MTDPLVVFKTRADARVAPKSELPPGHPARRPLGLAPGGGSGAPAADEPAALAPGAPTWTPQPGVPAMRDDLAMAMDVIRDIAEALVEAQDRAKAKFDTMQASFDNQIGALKNENQALRLILENLRITQRGERGIDGDRGPPGRDGRDGVGQIGPRGERGERGLPAPRISAWEPYPERFEIVPVLSTGERGPAIALLALFQAYDAAVQELEDRDIVSAAADSRARNEAETERANWAMR